MDKQKVLRFIYNQIKELEMKIKYMDYDYEDMHQTIEFFGEMKRLKGSKETLITMKNIIENMED